MDQEQHEMVLERTYPSGADEWYCPTCGRRLLLDYGPRSKKTVLEAGNEFAAHSGGKGGLRIGGVGVSPAHEAKSESDPSTSPDDPRLAPWNNWFEQVDFESLWRDDPQ